MDVLVATVISALMPVLLELLKRWRWFPLLQRGRPLLNRIMALIAAATTATGVSIQFDQTAGTLVLTGLVPDAMIRAGLLFVLSMLTQQGSYRRFIDPRPKNFLPTSRPRSRFR